MRRGVDIAVWMNFPRLRGQVHRALDHGLETLLDYPRLATIVAALDATYKIPGDAIEFGTFRGGSAGVILQNLSPEKILHVCDSFEGMPETTVEDNYHRKGDFAETWADRVIGGLSQLGNNFWVHKGFFSKTIPEMEANGPDRLSFAHIDADLYESVRDALEFCYPRMDRGSIIILDDYEAPSCEGAKQAVDEFFAYRPEQVERLSRPARGCLIGGGNLNKTLLSQARFPGLASMFGGLIFHKSDN
ncbi:MAG TPA: TylF/MycF/NovP-related O-methyltransferase [Pyrinomonadaceae bacterium]|nr:TylF/MycF/NovP-related O-methyltransferase [Pyrinomonadaceae bacterium]